MLVEGALDHSHRERTAGSPWCNERHGRACDRCWGVLARRVVALASAAGLCALDGVVPLLVDDGCGSETRTRSVSARFTCADGALLADATVELIEQRSGAPCERVVAVVMGLGDGSRGGPLRDRVLRARVRDVVSATDIAAVLVELPTGAAPLTDDEVLGAGDAAYAGSLSFAEVTWRVGLVAPCSSCAPGCRGGKTMRTPWTGARQSGWARASCS